MLSYFSFTQISFPHYSRFFYISNFPSHFCMNKTLSPSSDPPNIFIIYSQLVKLWIDFFILPVLVLAPPSLITVVMVWLITMKHLYNIHVGCCRVNFTHCLLSNTSSNLVKGIYIHFTLNPHVHFPFSSKYITYTTI